MRLRAGGLSGGISGDAAYVSASTSGSAFHPIFQQDLNYRADVLPDDPDGQVSGTISLMLRYRDEDAQSQEIGAEAAVIKDTYPSEIDQVCAVFSSTRGKISFLRDEYTSASLDFLSQTYSQSLGVGDVPIVEVLIRPRDMASMKVARYGDCDDFAMYAASLLTALGIPNSFVTLAGDDSNPNIFSHVYVAAYPMKDDGSGRVRVPVDASHGEYCGWEAPKPFARKQEWGDVQTGSMPSFACLLGIAAVVTGIAYLTGVLR